MKKNKSLFIMGAALLLLAGCTADEFSEHDGQVPVRLSVSQEATVTRAADGLYTASTGFSGSENVEVYVNSSDKHATFTVGTPDATTHQSSLTGTLYYPTTGDANLYAVYPSTSTSSHTVKYDQRSADNYKLSDLMYAKKTVTQDDKEDTQNLEFSHQLVKLKVIIKKAADVSQVTQVKMVNVKRTVSVTPGTSSMTVGTATATPSGNADYYSSDNNSILISNGESSSTSAETYTYACVFPKNTWSGNNFITVTADGKTLACQLTRAANEWTAGAEYTLTINVNAAALGTTVSITNWNDTKPNATIQPMIEVFPLTKASADDVGSLICSKGHIHPTTSDVNCGGSISGVIAYVGTAGSVETGTDYKGLALNLGYNHALWYTEDGGTCTSQTSDVTTALSYKNGLAMTQKMVIGQCLADGHTHAVASAAWNFYASRPSGASNWFIPSIGQWNLIVQGLATKKTGSSVTTDLTMTINSTFDYDNLNTVLSESGASNATLQKVSYSSSTEYDTERVWTLGSFGSISGGLKKKTSGSTWWRCVFAF